MKVLFEQSIDISGTVQQTHKFDRVFVSQIKEKVGFKAVDRPNTQVEAIRILKRSDLTDQRHFRKLLKTVFDRDEKHDAYIKVIISNVNKAFLDVALGLGTFKNGTTHHLILACKRLIPRSFIASKSFFVKGVGSPLFRPSTSRSSNLLSRRSCIYRRTRSRKNSLVFPYPSLAMISSTSCFIE